MPRPLEDQVVVLIGASSGLGRQTAYDLADRGATVVVAARRVKVLDVLTEELIGRGATDAAAIRCDVADEDAVDALIDAVVDQYGRIDTLMVMPGVALYAPIEQTTLAEFERMLDVLLLGYIRATKAVLPVFRRQGYGTLINVASVLGKSAVPLQGAYTTAKHGVVGFTRTLQLELDASGIAVCLALPGSMATPLQAPHARSKMARVPKPVEPIFHPRVVSRKLVRCAERPRATIKPDPQSRLALLAGKVAPGLMRKLTAKTGWRAQLTDRPEPARGHDNLDAPMAEGTGVVGGIRPTRQAARDWLQSHPVKAVGVAVGGLAVAAVAARALTR